MRRSFAVLAAAVFVVGGCGGGSDAAPDVPPEVTGVIVAIEGAGSDVHSFTVDNGPDQFELLIDPAVDYGFDLAHLREHQATRAPVRCRVEARDGEHYAVVIADA